MRQKNQPLIPLIFDLAFYKMFAEDGREEKIALLISIFLDLDPADLKNNIEFITPKKIRNKNKSFGSKIRIKISFSINEKICLVVLLNLNQEQVEKNSKFLELLFNNKLKKKRMKTLLKKQVKINFTNQNFTKEKLKKLASKKRNKKLKIYHINVEECFHIYQTKSFQYYSKKMQQEILLGSLLVQKNRNYFQKILKEINTSKKIKQEILKTSLKISKDQNMIQYYYYKKLQNIKMKHLLKTK